jgi:uncharacterized protein
MKKLLLAFAFLLVVVGAFYLTSSYLKDGKPLSLFKKTPIVTIGNHSFKVVAVSTQKEQEIGLSKTKSLSPDRGMIFLFKKLDYYLFWMKNMKFPIDIIYINNDKIVTIKNNVQIPKNNTDNLPIYSSTEPADKVLEIQAGLSQKYNFKNGDKLKYENLSD